MSIYQLTEAKKKNQREFSLEKIATAIHAEKCISSLRNKYIDPLIIRRKHLLAKTKSKEFKTNDNDPFSLNKILCHEYIKQKIKKEDESEKACQTNNKLIKRKLPLIVNKNPQKKNPNNPNDNNSNQLPDNFLITSGMFKQKEYYKDPKKKIKLASIMNLQYNSNEERIINRFYPRIDNIKKANEVYNLQLDLKHLIERNKKEKQHQQQQTRKMSKKSLMNYLFKKYVGSTDDIIDKNININSRNRKHTKRRHKSRKKSLLSTKSINSENSNDEHTNKINSYNDSIDSNHNTVFDNYKKDYYNEDKNTFLTKLNLSDNGRQDINGLSCENRPKKRNINLKNLKLLEMNKNIINRDQKITVDCLYSSVTKIEPKKIFCKPIDKTTFQLQNEPSYQKVKKFESMIDKIIKK
jgi:hypothetical protein